MKFGRNLPRNQVPEWAYSYINYKSLKKLIKTAQTGEKVDGEADLAGFFYSLDRNLEDVNQFYNKKYQDFSRRLKLLEDRYGVSPQAAHSLETEEREDLLAALLELRTQMRNLQWYGEVNRRGFIKITKKLDKKVPGANAQKKYVELKVDPMEFATNDQLVVSLNAISEWIYLLNEAAAEDSTTDKSSSSSASLKRTISRPSLNIAPEQFGLIEQYIRQDNSGGLESALAELKETIPNLSEHTLQEFLKTLLQRAVTARMRACSKSLLQHIIFLDDYDDINRRNVIHKLVVSIGRAQAHNHSITAKTERDTDIALSSFDNRATTNTAAPKSVAENQTIISNGTDKSIDFLRFLLDNLRSSQRSSLLAKDNSGRTPLHSAAEYGVLAICETFLQKLDSWKLFDSSGGLDTNSWQDNDGWTPLYFSVIGGHLVTTKVLLEAEGMSTSKVRRNPKTAAVLALAVKSNFTDIVGILVKANIDINFQDEQGEAALHIAARFGNAECARFLLEGSEAQKPDISLRENTYGWTPLFIACVEGHLSIVELLIEAGADLEVLDTSGWTAKEHAALRGHMDIAQRLAATMVPSESDSSLSSSPPFLGASLINGDSVGNKLNDMAISSNASDSVKTFGHRYLTDKSMILLSLGSMDMRKHISPVILDHVPADKAHSNQLDTALSLVVSAQGAGGEPEVIDLPVQDNISTEPIAFYAEDPAKVKILFDLIPTYSGSTKTIFGRGVALLSTIKPSVGSKRMLLKGDLTVPIIASADLDVIGTVNFNFLVITPFKHPNMSISEDRTYWKKVASTMVIGHRGLGKNVATRNSLQLGENTIQSFIAAANLGASYVEFDVQLTKDLVPVIYHDFTVSETGIDAPVHTLTLEQFLHVNDQRTPRSSRPGSPVLGPEHPKLKALKSKGRSMSVGGADNDTAEMDERMKHTYYFKKKGGFKGNMRGNHIQAPFATLEEMFKKLPADVGFNIEMKYPMLSETEDEDIDNYAVELNSFVDTVLTKVYDLGNGRNVIFSSFNPDICLLLSFKQPSIPILFLTDAGCSPVGDIRASSLQEAIRFTSRWGMLGIVTTAQPLVIAPRLVRVVKESGLVCVSYGSQNNDKDLVKRQVRQGIDAVIVDNVLAIRKGLTEDAWRLDVPAHGKELSPAENGLASIGTAPIDEDVHA